MIETTVRAMKEEEREALQLMLQPSGLTTQALMKQFLLGGLLVSISVLCLGLFALAFKLSGALLIAACIISTLCGLASLFFGLNLVASAYNSHQIRRFSENELAPQIKAAINDGKVKVLKVESEKLIVLEEFEDEGSGYLFDIGKGRTLLLKGREYYPTNEESAWPNTSFELVRTETHAILISLNCYGKELNPSQRIDLSKCNEEFIWSEEEKVIDGTPDQVLQKLFTKA
jgi:hypothetical protein